MSGFLERVMQAKREQMSRVSDAERELLAQQAREKAARRVRGRFAQALSRPGVNIIAEFKRRSPSAGAIRAGAEPTEVAKTYQDCGAAAMSVLTEPDHFGGSLDDLARVRRAVDFPLLRKDFVVDEHQLYEAMVAGADAALLIVAGLADQELVSLLAQAEAVGLDVLVEVHTAEELQLAAACGARIIGVNNRNLKTLQVSLNTSLELARLAPQEAILVSESGLRTAADIQMLQAAGYRGFLIGETLMRAPDPGAALRSLLGVPDQVVQS